MSEIDIISISGTTYIRTGIRPTHEEEDYIVFTGKRNDLFENINIKRFKVPRDKVKVVRVSSDGDNELMFDYYIEQDYVNDIKLIGHSWIFE